MQAIQMGSLLPDRQSAARLASLRCRESCIAPGWRRRRSARHTRRAGACFAYAKLLLPTPKRMRFRSWEKELQTKTLPALIATWTIQNAAARHLRSLGPLDSSQQLAFVPLLAQSIVWQSGASPVWIGR